MRDRNTDRQNILPRLLLAAIVAAAVPCTASDLEGQIDAVALAAVDAGRTPGLSIAVARGGEIIFSKGWGFADLENHVQSTATTNYGVGSITKPFTSLAIMQLVEQDKVDVGDPITRYIPGYDTHGATITVQELLNHTSGIPSYTDIERQDRSLWRLDRSHADMRAIFEPKELMFPPGTGWYYTNSGYYLLGMIIENVSGLSYDEYLAQKIVAPAGLANTQFGWQRPLIEQRARGYVRTEDGWVNSDPISMTTPFSAGALRSTVTDLVTWMRALTDGTLISTSSFRKMATVIPFEGDRGAHGYANGLYIGALGDHPKITHMGDIDGYSAQLAYYPADDLVIAVATNHQGAGPNYIERQVARAALGLPKPEPQDLPLTKKEIARWSGTYLMGALGIHLTETDGELYLSVDMFLPHPMKLLHQGGGEFWLEADPDNRLYFDPMESPATRVKVNFSDMIMIAVRSE